MEMQSEKVRLLRQDEMYGPGDTPVNYILGNYLVLRFKQELGRSDAGEFADLLLAELEPKERSVPVGLCSEDYCPSCGAQCQGRQEQVNA